MKKTKIVCTIGPASKDTEIIKKLIKEGMNVARINFSHGNYEENKPYIDAVKKAREELNEPIAILLDTQGPEIRTGKIESTIEMEEGQKIILSSEEILGDKDRIGITYKQLYKDINEGDTILVDDGKLELQVEKIENKEIFCVAKNKGEIGNRKSINVPNKHLNLPALKEKDIKDLIDGCQAKVDFISASFVRNEEDIKQIRKVLDENRRKAY